MESSANRHAPSPDAVVTFFESFDGWAQLIRQTESARGDSPDAAVGDATASFDTAESAGPAAEAAPWRPTRRPPTVLLHVVDDGRDTGETIRLRDDRLVLGRTTGTVSIHHDPHLEERHAQLDRLPGEGWLLTDLGSRDGTWVRVTTARLRHGTRLQLGATRVRFQSNGDAPAAFVIERPDSSETALPCPATPFLVCRAGAVIAGDDSVPLVLIDDALVSPIHAEVIVGRRGGLRIVNRGLNGLWVRLEAALRLSATAQFQCGDQRFVLEQATARLSTDA